MNVLLLLLMMLLSAPVRAVEPTASTLFGGAGLDPRALQANRVIARYQSRRDLCEGLLDAAMKVKVADPEQGTRLQAMGNTYCETVARAFSTEMTISRSWHLVMVREDRTLADQVASIDKVLTRLDRPLQRVIRNPTRVGERVTTRVAQGRRDVENLVLDAEDTLKTAKEMGF